MLVARRVILAHMSGTNKRLPLRSWIAGRVRVLYCWRGEELTDAHGHVCMRPSDPLRWRPAVAWGVTAVGAWGGRSAISSECGASVHTSAVAAPHRLPWAISPLAVANCCGVSPGEGWGLHSARLAGGGTTTLASAVGARCRIP